MSRKVFYEENFKCSSCEHFEKVYVWSDREKEDICSKCGKETFPHYEEIKEAFSIGTKMSKDKVVQERKKRSLEHFKKEIYPNLKKDWATDKLKKKHNLKD